MALFRGHGPFYFGRGVRSCPDQKEALLIERRVFVQEPDGSLVDPGFWEPVVFDSFDVAVDSWVSIWEETTGGAVVVERDALRAVVVAESDLGETGTFVLVGEEVSGGVD